MEAVREMTEDALQSSSDESMGHARQAGELFPALGGQVPLGTGPLLEKQHGRIDEMHERMMQFETVGIGMYYELMPLAEQHRKPGSVMLEEYARTMVLAEEQHLSEIEKMLRERAEAL